MNKILSSFKWIFFVSQRLSRVDRKGRSAVTSFLASLGVCFGVMALIVSISVMNGFQMSFIDAIMEISSYHVRVKNVEDPVLFDDYCRENKKITATVPFYESQGLMASFNGKQSPVLIRALPENVMTYDKGFEKELKVYQGDFNLSGNDGIVLGHVLARNLGVRIGSKVNLMALSGGSDVNLFSANRVFTVRGIFYSGYEELNSTYAFINIKDGQKYFGKNCPLIYGIKISDSNKDSQMISSLKKNFPEADVDSWRSYNRSFFGALRMEKNMLFLLVFLIFVVVAINIYNGMRRMVYERREEIAVLSSFGARKNQIQDVFILRGFLTGFLGAIPGLLLGLLICVHMEDVFLFLSKAVYNIQYVSTLIFSPQNAGFVRENPMFKIYAQLPAKVFMGEALFITFFGIFSSLLSSWFASRGVLKFTVSEVLRNE